MLHELRELIEEVKADICDGYCKYPAQNLSREEMLSICVDCPLDRLD